MRRPYADLLGEGATIYGGRFNPPGVPAVYTSQHIALAVLEILVYIDKSEVPEDFVLMTVRFSGKNIHRWKGSDPIPFGSAVIDVNGGERCVEYCGDDCGAGGQSRCWQDIYPFVQALDQVLLQQQLNVA